VLGLHRRAHQTHTIPLLGRTLLLIIRRILGAGTQAHLLLTILIIRTPTTRIPKEKTHIDGMVACHRR